MLEYHIQKFCESVQNDYKKIGIDDFELSISNSNALSAQTRNVKLENIESAEVSTMSLNVMIGKKQATLTTNSVENINIRDFLEKGKFMANSSPEDPFAGLPDLDEYEKSFENLNLEDKTVIDEDKLIASALQAEEKMLSIHGVTNTEGASASSTKSKITFLSSKGFFESYIKTLFSISTIAIAGKNTNMQRDYDYSAAVHLHKLKNPSEIGKKAGERAVSRLNAKKIKSCFIDVVFEPRIAKSLLSSLASCISGTSIARGTSFLSNKMNQQICNKNINITNMPKLNGGIGSIPFDTRGIKSSNLNLVENGFLKNYLLGLRSSRQLNLKPNGNSSPYNLTLSKGNIAPKDLIQSLKKGFYVTEMLGMSFNPVNGDYSRGAAGFMIENGKITFPINEVTIAGNMKDILKKIEPANDLEIKENINSPTILVKNMSLAGI